MKFPKAILLMLIVTLVNSKQAASLTLITDDETESVIREIAAPIFKAASITQQSMNIYILQDDSINAFVVDGHNMFINTGLIKFSDDPNVIAGVIAHETGHIVGGHVSLMKDQIGRLKAQMAVSALAAIAAGAASGSSDAALGAYALGEHLSVGSTLKFSRAQESAADEAAMKFMKKAHVNPEGLIKLLKFFASEERIFSGQKNSYFNTHPISKDRLNILEKFAVAFHNFNAKPEIEYKFSLVHAKIDAFTSKPDLILKKYRGDSDADKYARAIAAMKKGDNATARSLMQELISKVPSQPFFYELMAQIFVQAKDIKSASGYFEKALSLRPRSSVIEMEYASALINSRSDLDRAVELLNGLIDHDPHNAGAYHMLAGAYNLKKDKNNSVLALAYYNYLVGDMVRSKNLLKQLDAKTAGTLRAKDLESLLKADKDNE